LYDRKLVEYLRVQGDVVEIISLPWRNYAAHLTDNFSFRLPANLDILIQDELNHPSLITANQKPHPSPVISLVHHLRSSELRPKWRNDLYRMIEKKYLQSVDGFIFNSQTTMGVVNGLIGKRKPSVTAYPPADRFEGVISEEEIKKRADNKLLNIIFLGNIITRKGLQTLLEAIRLLTFNIQLDIIGSLTIEPNYAEQMKEFVVINGLSSMVNFHGALNDEALIEKLKQAHLLIVPSSYEGFGIVYLEGMCFGLPAIGTTAGAAGEIIEHKKTGYLIQPNDHQKLAAYLTQLASNRGLLTDLSLNARRRYLQQPAWTRTAGQIRAFLQNMIG
jgi:glycosyltransferase involved in cell wall biosynthesis